MRPSYHPTTEPFETRLSQAAQTGWHFAGLSAAALMPYLQQHLSEQDARANWQLVWLNNDGQPVIGLLPKVSWALYPTDARPSCESSHPYQVIKRCRTTDIDGDIGAEEAQTTNLSYLEWQEALIAYSRAQTTVVSALSADQQKNAQPHYQHGLIGFIGYDIAAHELSPSGDIGLAMQPCAVLGHYDVYLTPKAADPKTTEQTGWVLNTQLAEDDPTTRDHCPQTALLRTLIAYLETLNQKLSDKPVPLTQDKKTHQLPPLHLSARWSKQAYQQAFDRTQHYLKQGDCYQINLTQKWSGRLPYHDTPTQPAPALIDYLPALYHNTQAPFAGYLSVNIAPDLSGASAMTTRSFELLSCSPELFFTFTKAPDSGRHHIITKPIKGTMPRGTTTEQDKRYQQQLNNSEKDRAENVMIVDLLRNDLGKFAKIGSVKVPTLFAIEHFSNVHHMVSTITAELKADTHPLAVLFGSLPAGSITGTPKKRAVEIISELETTPRGSYCGTMGYMNFDGSGQWNVLIRTLQASAPSNAEATAEANAGGQVNLWAGGGITIASDGADEYQECLDKVGNLLTVLAQDDPNQYP